MLRNFYRLLDPSFNIIAPYFNQTKAEILEVFKAYHEENIISSSVSCSSSRRKPGQVPHCGCCSQCIDRRFSVYAAGLNEYDAEYANDFISAFPDDDKNETKQRIYITMRLANLEDISTRDDFVQKYPSDVLDMIQYWHGPHNADDKLDEIYSLVCRYGKSVIAAATAMRNKYDDLTRPINRDSLLGILSERGLISGILFEVLGDYIYNDYKDVNDLQNSIYKEIEKLTDSNPYNGSSSVPWITLKKYLKLLKKQDENYNERRLVEETYIISPNNNKMLWDELLDSRAKDKKDWVYNRLINLGFTHSFEDNSHLFTMNYESNYIIYADPRLESSIEMRIYKINHSINTMEYDYINSFKFLDYWVKDLNKKLISKINNLII